MQDASLSTCHDRGKYPERRWGEGGASAERRPFQVCQEKARRVEADLGAWRRRYLHALVLVLKKITSCPFLCAVSGDATKNRLDFCNLNTAAIIAEVA